jgi:hypothetical protein
MYLPLNSRIYNSNEYNLLTLWPPSKNDSMGPIYLYACINELLKLAKKV